MSTVYLTITKPSITIHDVADDWTFATQDLIDDHFITLQKLASAVLMHDYGSEEFHSIVTAEAAVRASHYLVGRMCQATLSRRTGSRAREPDTTGMPSASARDLCQDEPDN